MSIETSTPGEPFRRTSAHEEADHDEAGQNLLNKRWQDWPNEAGFNCFEEHRGPEELKVEGTIPAWCAGSLFRTGPGLSELETESKGTFRVSHWFDGFAHSHRFDILPMDAAAGGTNSDGDGSARVTYSSRRQAEPLMDRIRKKGSNDGITFGQRADPCVGLFSKCMSTFVQMARKERRQYFNVQVVPHPDVPEFGQKITPKTPTTTTPTPPDATPAASGHRVPVQNLWIATDAAHMMRVNPETLEPIGPAYQRDIHPLLTGPLSASHAQRDPATGDFFNFNTAPGRTTTHRIFRLRADTGAAEILAEIRDRDPVPAPPSYVHSFFLTENFVVLCLPVSGFKLGGLHILWEKNLADSIQPFDENGRCRWFVVDRRHGRGLVARFDSPAAFFFHSVNAFEEPAADGTDGVDIFADVVQYPNHDIMHAMYYDNLLNRNGSAEKFWTSGHHRTTQPQLVRYRLHIPHPDTPLLPTNTSWTPAELTTRILGPHIGELPTINPAHRTRRSRFIYSGAVRGLATSLMDSLVKTDVDSREAVFWTGPQGHTPGEPVFVARPVECGGGGEEDDGVLLSVVLDGHAGASYLLCLDARSMKEMGRARCAFPVPFGFHGVHVKSPL